MTTTPNEPIAIGAGEIVAVLQETHPDAVRMAMWRVRAEKAEAENAKLKATTEPPAATPSGTEEDGA